MKRWSIVALVAVAALIVWLALPWPSWSRSDVEPITALPAVHYSPGGEWILFYRDPPAGTGWVHLPTPAESASWRSNIDPATRGFVRPEVCGECHADQYEGFLATAHHRTSAEATRETVKGSFEPGGNLLETRDPGLRFEFEATDDGLFQRLLVDRDGQRYEHRVRFDLVTGSGNHGQTYLYWEGDQLCQLPVSYFTEAGGWINSPGNYRDGTADFARGIGDRCLECHTTFFAAAPEAFNRYDRTNYILGVGCVRCHGPGWAHVQYHRHHPESDEARYIVHPGELPRDRANEVCAQCHSGVGISLEPPFSYRPGEPLAEYLTVDLQPDNPQNDDPHAANQLARLMQSRCFTESEQMTCATCHDPHQHERGDLSLFAERCATCHAPDDCHLAGEFGERIEQRCIECHMPGRRDASGAMETAQGELLPLLRDHLIRNWPGASQRVIDELRASVE